MYYVRVQYPNRHLLLLFCRAESRFRFENERRVSDHLHCSYLNDMAFRWLAIRVEYLGNVVILLTGIFTTYYR